MKRSPAIQPGQAAFRPWPYGPPLRGRAPGGLTGLGPANLGATWPDTMAPPHAQHGGLEMATAWAPQI